jgi:hypothetical protein
MLLDLSQQHIHVSSGAVCLWQPARHFVWSIWLQNVKFAMFTLSGLLADITLFLFAFDKIMAAQLFTVHCVCDHGNVVKVY